MRPHANAHRFCRVAGHLLRLQQAQKYLTSAELNDAFLNGGSLNEVTGVCNRSTAVVLCLASLLCKVNTF